MDERRSFLKDLAARFGDAWASASRDLGARSDARIETRNTVYQLRDGICFAVARRDRPWRADPTVFIGMRLVGWLAGEDPEAGLMTTWRPGAFAVLWRARSAGEPHSSVALTSKAESYELTTAVRSNAPPLPRTKSTPPPLPRPPAVPTFATPPTMTRVNIPRAPETPTPVMNVGAQRTLPPSHVAAARRPLPPRPTSSASHAAI